MHRSLTPSARIIKILYILSCTPCKACFQALAQGQERKKKNRSTQSLHLADIFMQSDLNYECTFPSIYLLLGNKTTGDLLIRCKHSSARLQFSYFSLPHLSVFCDTLIENLSDKGPYKMAGQRSKSCKQLQHVSCVEALS